MMLFLMFQDDDCEEGEIKEPGERTKRPFIKPMCRFFQRGHCTWGINCRFLHPGVNDKGRTINTFPRSCSGIVLFLRILKEIRYIVNFCKFSK